MKGRIGILAILLLSGVLAARAADTTWTGSVLGDWFDAGNWTGGVPVLSATDAAVIDTGIATISTGTALAQAGFLYVGGANTGSTAGLGISGKVLSPFQLVVGRDAGASGLVSIGGGGGIQQLTSSVIGASGTGVLTITGTSEVTTTGLTIGKNAGGTGTVEVNGAGSSVYFSYVFGEADLSIGDVGTGTLRIVNGAALDSGAELYATIGSAGGSGTLEVAGAGSSFRGDFLALGTGTIEARDGGLIVLRDEIAISGTAAIQIGAGSQVGASDEIAMNESTTVTFTLEGEAAGDYGLLSSDHLALDGTLRITLAGGYVPGLGDSFFLLDFTTTTGAFTTYDLPSLEPGLAWDTSQLTADGTLLVIPEPASGSLLLAALAAVQSRRRYLRR